MSQKLFEYLHNELGVIALVDQMDEIKRIVLYDSNEDIIKETRVLIVANQLKMEAVLVPEPAHQSRVKCVASFL